MPGTSAPPPVKMIGSGNCRPAMATTRVAIAAWTPATMSSDATPDASSPMISVSAKTTHMLLIVAGWRLWALAKAGRADVIVSDLRKRWAVMDSVIDNKTLQEDWTARRDSGQQWSHCAVVPLYIAYHGLMGLKPLLPGFSRFEVKPQFGNLNHLELTAHTVQGPITLRAQGAAGERQVAFELPPEGQGEIVLPIHEKVGLPKSSAPAPAGHVRYALPRGGSVSLKLCCV